MVDKNKNQIVNKTLAKRSLDNKIKKRKLGLTDKQFKKSVLKSYDIKKISGFKRSKLSHVINSESDSESDGDGDTGGINDDHSNFRVGATSIVLNSTFGGILEQAGDKDVFAFTVTTLGDISITSTANDFVIVGCLHDSNDAIVDEENHATTVNPDTGESVFTTNSTLSPGDYYLELYSMDDNIGDYTSNISFQEIVKTHVELNSITDDILELSGDEHVFSFDITEPGKTTIYVSESDGWETKGTLISPSDDLLAAYNGALHLNIDSGGSGDFIITRYITEPGTYCATVAATNENAENIPYTFHVDFEAGVKSGGDDHSDFFVGATPISNGETIAGEMVSSDDGDPDCFVFELTSNSDVSITIPEESVTNQALVNSSGEVIRMTGGDTIGEGDIFVTLGSGTYFIIVDRYDILDPNPNPYTLSLVIEESSGSNGGVILMGDLALNSTISDVSMTDQNMLRYKITITESGVLDVKTTGDADTYGILYDSDDNELDNDDDTDEFNFQIVQSVTPGDYWLNIELLDDGTGTFDLVATFLAS